MAGSRNTSGGRLRNTRAKIVASGFWVFLEAGYHSSTVAEIAERARLSKGAIYHHFHSKDELLQAVLEDFASELQVSLSAAFIGSDGPVDTLRKLMASIFVAFSAGQGRVQHVVAEASAINPLCEAVISRIRRSTVDTISRCLDETVLAAATTEIDSRIIALAWFGAIREVALYAGGRTSAATRNELEMLLLRSVDLETERKPC